VGGARENGIDPGLVLPPQQREEVQPHAVPRETEIGVAGVLAMRPAAAPEVAAELLAADLEEGAQPRGPARGHAAQPAQAAPAQQAE